MTDKELFEALVLEEDFSNFDKIKRTILTALHPDQMNRSLHQYSNILREAIDKAIISASNRTLSLT